MYTYKDAYQNGLRSHLKECKWSWEPPPSNPMKFLVMVMQDTHSNLISLRVETSGYSGVDRVGIYTIAVGLTVTCTPAIAALAMSIFFKG